MKIQNQNITVFVKGGWGVDVNLWTFEEGGDKDQESENKGEGGSNFWSFYDKVMIECPLTSQLLSRSSKKGFSGSNK